MERSSQKNVKHVQKPSVCLCVSVMRDQPQLVTPIEHKCTTLQQGEKVCASLNVSLRFSCWCLHEFRTCMWFPQVRGPRFVAATEASSFLNRQCVSGPPFRLLWVGVTTLAAYHTCLALARGLCVVSCLSLLHQLLPLLYGHHFRCFLSLLLPLLPLLQRLFLQR